MIKRNSLAARQIWLLGFAWLVIIVDQLIKNFLLNTLTPGEPVEFLGSLVRLNLTFNDSAAFSIGFGATWIFTIISSIAVLVLIWYSFKIETLSWSIMAGILLGGVSGNLIDRYIREPGFAIGYVVDYIQIPFSFPIFNIADMAIFFICSISVIRILLGHQIGRQTVAK